MLACFSAFGLGDRLRTRLLEGDDATLDFMLTELGIEVGALTLFDICPKDERASDDDPIGNL